MKRRMFIVGSATAMGGLLLGYQAWIDSFETEAAALVTRSGESLLAGWVKSRLTTRSPSTCRTSTWGRASTRRWR